MLKLMASIFLLCFSTGIHAQNWDKLPALDTLIARAIVRSHGIKELQLKASQEHQMLLTEKKSWLSSFRLGMQFFSVEQRLADGEPAPSVGLLPNVGSSLQLNLHQLFTTKNRVRVAQGSVERTQEGIAMQEEQLALWLMGKYLDHQSAMEQISFLQQILDTQEQQLVLVKTRFEKGEGKIEDLLSQQNALIQTKDALLKAKTSAEKSYREIQIIAGQ